jgi:hypothetical protein
MAFGEREVRRVKVLFQKIKEQKKREFIVLFYKNKFE